MLLQELSWPRWLPSRRRCRSSFRSPPSSSTGVICPFSPTACCWAKSFGWPPAVLGDRVVWTPLLWLGNSHHHMDFAGTLSAAPRTYLDLLGDLIDNLVTPRFPPDRALERPRRQHRSSRAGRLRSPPALPSSSRPAAAFRDVLALGLQAETSRSVARAGSRWATPASGRRR